jgi:hypothetical protein
VAHRVFSYLYILFRTGHWWAEFWSAFAAISWGVFNFLNPTPMPFPSYQMITSMGPQDFWEMFAVLIGVFQITTLVYNQRWVRAFGAFAACWFYTLLVLGFLLASPIPSLWPLAAGYAGANVFALLRLVWNVK